MIRSIHLFFPAAMVANVAVAQSTVGDTTPARHASNVAANATIAIDSDRASGLASNPPATNDARVFGSVSGMLAGAWSLESGATRLRSTPSRSFAAGTLLRFGTQAAVAGHSSFPGSSADTRSDACGTAPGSVVTHWYQVFYRTAAAGFRPPATADVTNGIVVTW